jgi:hypothetical protein
MTPPISRRFSLLDVMILIGASAVGFTLIRGWNDLVGWTDSQFQSHTIHVYAALFLLPFSLAFLLIRLRSPRAVGHQLLRQPGMQVVLAVGSALLIRCINFLPAPMYTTTGSFPSGMVRSWLLTFGTSVSQLGEMVAFTWFLSKLTGSRQSEPSWIDRGGRIYGWCWILIWLSEIGIRCWRSW